MISANAVYWIMLTQALGYNTPKIKKLAEMYEDIAAFIQKGETEWRLCGLFHALDIEKLSAMNIDDAQKVLDRCEQLHYSVLAIDDPAYPARLYHIYAPPAVLYISGTLPDFDSNLSVAIVGTRRASHYGTDNSYKFAYALAKYNTVIVSGGALGVDCASHRGALAANGVTVCVRGCGINSRYLKDNAKMREAITLRGAVISEYPPDVDPWVYFFPARNRIIAALSDGVVLMEAGAKSGSLITADCALEMGKDVFALLGNNSPSNEGSNFRIKEGTAVPVTDFMDILAYYSREEVRSGLVNFDDILLSDLEAVPVKGGKYRDGIDPPVPPQKHLQRKPGKTEKNTAKTRQTAAEAPPKEQPTKTATPSEQAIRALKGDAKRIYHYLTAEPVHINIIADDLGLPVNRVLTTLTLLEVQGFVTALQGRKYKQK